MTVDDIRRTLARSSRPAIATVLSVAISLASAAPARAGGAPRIRTEFREGVLHVSVSDLPPAAGVEVRVADTTHDHDEMPNGTPPRSADGEGQWPGRDGGDIVGYPGTDDDPGGTTYRVCVIVNGETGPCESIEKETTFFEDVLEVINVFKHVGRLFRWFFA